MLEFTKLEPEHIGVIKAALAGRNDICDFTVGGIYLWRGWFNTHFCIDGDTLYLRLRDTDGAASFAFTGGDPEDAYLRIMQYCNYTGERFRVSLITVDVLDTLRSVIGGHRFFADRDRFDYIYQAPELCELTGKRWNGQRNHINRFKRTFDGYTVSSIDSDADIEQVRGFFKHLKTTRLKSFPAAFEELERIDEALQTFHELGLDGMFVIVDGAVVGATFGEVVGDVLFVHVEKALVEYNGIYPFLTSSFACRHSDKVKYINREEDEGDDGLRRAKLSYHPVVLKEKYVIG